MASLIPIPASGLSVSYHGLGRKLLLRAEGDIPAYFITPFFQQELSEGCLRFALKAYNGVAIPESPPQHINITYELPIHLPIRGFNNRTVLIDTSLGTFEKKIEYIEWPEPPSDVELVAAATSDSAAPIGSLDRNDVTVITVLPPIEVYLPGEGTLSMTSLIPKERNSRLDIEFNPDFVRVINVGISQGYINWIVNWAKVLTVEDNLQIFNVITTTKAEVWPAIYPPYPNISKVIQPYIIRVWPPLNK